MRRATVAEDVSRRMRAVLRKNTSAEIQLQTALRRLHLRFQTHVPVLGCCPDIVFPLSRVVVFVDGGFWHGRLLVEGGTIALRRSFQHKSRLFWVAKITRNATRDQRQTHRLRRHGWSVMRFWGRDVLNDSHARAVAIAERVSYRRQSIRNSSEP